MNVFTSLLISGCLLIAATTRAAERRVALVVGCGESGDADRNVAPAVRDAEVVGARLRALRFDSVDVRVNLTKSEIDAALKRFHQEVQGATVGVIYFAGHAYSQGGLARVIPTGARLNDEATSIAETVSHEDLLNSMVGVGAEAKVVILDCCRANPFAKTRTWLAKAPHSPGLADIKLQKTHDSLILFAAEPGHETKDDLDKGCSALALALDKVLSQESPDIMRHVGLVAAEVRNATQKAQSPWIKTEPSSQILSLIPFAPPPVPVKAIEIPQRHPPVATKPSNPPETKSKNSINPFSLFDPAKGF